MATVITFDVRRAARRAEAEPSSLIVWIGAATALPRASGSFAAIRVSVRRRALAAKLTKAMADATRAIADPALGTEGAIAVVKVTARNLRRLGERVEALRASGVLGVQLVWDGRDPAPAIAEAKVFAVLERARSTPLQVPVVLARDEEPVPALRILVAARGKKEQGQP